MKVTEQEKKMSLSYIFTTPLVYELTEQKNVSAYIKIPFINLIEIIKHENLHKER